MNKNINRTRSNRRHYRNQVRFTRTVLGIATLVALTILFVIAAKAVGTMVVTGAKMWNISNNVSYYEQQREFALETGRGNYATECDEVILTLYADRNALINSDNPIVAFTAMHKLYAMGIILGFVALVGLIIKVIVNRPDETFRAFTTVIDIEQLLVRILVAALSFVLMITFKVIGMSTTRISEAFTLVWNQSRPRRKPQHREPKNSRQDAQNYDNVIDFRRHA